MSQKNGDEIKEYQEAVWAFMLEHSKILSSGKMRIIFDTDGRINFEKRVRARFRGYHREDYKKKEEMQQEKRRVWEEEKEQKRERYLTGKKERRKMQLSLKEIHEAHERMALSETKTYYLVEKIKEIWQKVTQ